LPDSGSITPTCVVPSTIAWKARSRPSGERRGCSATAGPPSCSADHVVGAGARVSSRVMRAVAAMASRATPGASHARVRGAGGAGDATAGADPLVLSPWASARKAKPRSRATEHLVQHHAEAEDVAAVIGIQSAHLLRRRVADRAHDDAGTRQRDRHCRVGMSRCLRHLRQTEIEDLRAAIPGQQDVLRLQIAVHDAGRVRRGQAAGDLGGDVEHLPQAEPGAAQRLAVDELADDVALADVVDGDDIGVAQGRNGTGLDLTHSPGAERGNHFVGSEACAGNERREGHVGRSVP
jgi:hypothetical protein